MAACTHHRGQRILRALLAAIVSWFMRHERLSIEVEYAERNAKLNETCHGVRLLQLSSRQNHPSRNVPSFMASLLCEMYILCYPAQRRRPAGMHSIEVLYTALWLVAATILRVWSSALCQRVNLDIHDMTGPDQALLMIECQSFRVNRHVFRGAAPLSSLL